MNSFGLNWSFSKKTNPQNGDCYFDPDQSLVRVFTNNNWIIMGSLEDDTEQNIKRLLRDEKIEKIIKTDEL